VCPERRDSSNRTGLPARILDQHGAAKGRGLALVEHDEPLAQLAEPHAQRAVGGSGCFDGQFGERQDQRKLVETGGGAVRPLFRPISLFRGSNQARASI
jgi:hypothetical protein